MHNYSICFRLHNYIRKDRTQQIFLHATINSKRVKIPTKIYCKKSNFKDENCKDSSKNAVLEHFKLRSLEIFQNARYLNKPLSVDRFQFLLKNGSLDTDFVEWMWEAMKKESQYYEFSTFKSWRKSYNKLKEFRKSVLIADIDINFVRNFDKFLKSKGYAHNTIVGHHKRIAKFIRIAIKEMELKIDDPYQSFSTIYIEGDREFLEPFEIEKMVKLYELRNELDLPEHLGESLRMFLFMVGSGLRISDSGRLDGLHIRGNSIKIRAQKTKRWKIAQRLPLSEFSKKYIDKEEGKLFKYSDCQTLNKNLKVICRYLNINKKITSHCARHTFATTFLLAGGKVEVLKELLNHSDIKTTMIYVHITKDVERKQLNLLDKFLTF